MYDWLFLFIGGVGFLAMGATLMSGHHNPFKSARRARTLYMAGRRHCRQFVSIWWQAPRSDEE
jgi:hypothetical protein